MGRGLQEKGCGRDARAPGWASSTLDRKHGLHPAQESGKAPPASLKYHSPLEGESARQGRSPRSSRRGADSASRGSSTRGRAGGGPTRRPVRAAQQHSQSHQARPSSSNGTHCPKAAPASVPHRISLRHSARLLRLPLKGGVIHARASRPHKTRHDGRGPRKGGFGAH